MAATIQKYCAPGGTLQNVVKITTYVTDVRRRMDFRVVRDEFFGQRGPASTMVQVASLSHPDYMIEIVLTDAPGLGLEINEDELGRRTIPWTSSARGA